MRLLGAVTPAAAAPAVAVAIGLSPAAALELAFPVDCTIAVDCAVQHYVDRDPGPEVSDYRCGSQTYDGHDGTDIRIPDLRAMASGVKVFAAADGIVSGTRDEMPDRSVREASLDSVKDRECGNGVLIEHADGWSTQYCHMKRWSIAVKRGDKVHAGTVLGEVGLSGETEFPHLHFTVRKDGKTVDPYAPAPLASGACAFAGDDSGSLWAPAAKAQTGYRPAFVLNAGFADAPVEKEQIESGELRNMVVKSDSPALVFYGLAIGLEKGDRQRLSITGPDGQILAEDDVEPTDRSKAQFFAYVGKKRRDQPWPAGTYNGRYSVFRDGDEVAFKEVQIEIRP